MLTRKMDKLRRIVIPNDVYMRLKLKEYQNMEMTIEYGCICIRVHNEKDIEKRPYVGIVRGLDQLHRIVIPKEYLKVLNLKENTRFVMELEGKTIRIYPKEE